MKPRVFEMRWLEATPPVRKGRLSRDEKAEWAERSDRLGREVAKIRARVLEHYSAMPKGERL